MVQKQNDKCYSEAERARAAAKALYLPDEAFSPTLYHEHGTDAVPRFEIQKSQGNLTSFKVNIESEGEDVSTEAKGIARELHSQIKGNAQSIIEAKKAASGKPYIRLGGCSQTMLTADDIDCILIASAKIHALKSPQLKEFGR